VPLYFFHVRGGVSPADATEGWEHSNEIAAKTAATAAARGLISADVLDGVLDLAAAIEVEDPNGNLVFRVPFDSVVRQS
jgi:hypothetical protein